MAYLINEETKCHRVMSVSDVIGGTLPRGKWKVVECDQDGWIQWNGDSERPLPDDVWAEVKTRGGLILKGYQSRSAWLWKHYVIAYRPVLDQPTRSTTMEPNLAEQIVAAATNQEVTESVFAANNTLAFREAVQRLLTCRETLEALGDYYEIIDGRGDFLDQRVIDRARAAVGLPTAIDGEIAKAEKQLAELKTQREEMLR